MSADDMLKLGTYNALIGEDGVKGVYETNAIDFSASHKMFKGAMKTFNWEVIEVIGGPPKVSIKWRHWGRFYFPFIVSLNRLLVTILINYCRKNVWQLQGEIIFG